MNPSKMDSIFKLLSEYDFDVCENIPNNLKCTKCQNIVNNAKQIPCGCRFCGKCLERLIENDSEYCPGITDLCKNARLLDSNTDYSINRDVSNIVVKCPFLCHNEDKLINMDGHMMVCSKKVIKCVFNNFGCGNKILLKEDIENHLQSDLYGHMKMLVYTVEDVRRDNEIMKIEKENIKNEIENIKNEIEHVRNENKDMRCEIENLSKDNENMRKQSESLIQNMHQEILLSQRSGRLVKFVDKLEERKKNNEYIRTQYFYGELDPYKMSFGISLNGEDDKGTNLSIRLFIWYDDRNDTFKWPFVANVTITVRNNNALKSQTRAVKLGKPAKKTPVFSDILEFAYSHLYADKLLVDNFMIVECIVIMV